MVECFVTRLDWRRKIVGEYETKGPQDKRGYVNHAE